MLEPLLDTYRTVARFCTAPEGPQEVPLRIKQELAPYALDDPEYKAVTTEDLMRLARDKKHVHVADRASAIAVLKGIVNSRIVGR